MTLSIPLKPWEVRGILDGWLNQLVRPVANKKLLSYLGPMLGGSITLSESSVMMDSETGEDLSPFGKPGNVLWVQEPWFKNIMCGEIFYTGGKHEFKKWLDAETMPREYSRLSIMNVETKVKRLNSLGIAETPGSQEQQLCTSEDFFARVYETGKGQKWDRLSRSDSFAKQWNTDYPDTPWESNPWCWVATIRKEE